MPKKLSPEANGPSLFQERRWFLFKVGPRLKELEEFYKCGVLAALYDALDLVQQTGSHPPDWVLEGALHVVGEKLKSGTGSTARYRQAMKDYRRWQAFNAARNDGEGYDKAFDAAAERLEGTFAAAGGHSVEKSVKKVKKNLKDAKGRYAYYPARKSSQDLTMTPTLRMQQNKKA